MTVPLSVLKSNMICFTPSLPERKTQAIQSLGAGLVEKVGGAFVHVIVYLEPVCICFLPHAFAHYVFAC